MEKDFDLWNCQKKRIDDENRSLFFKEGEVWWCSLGLNIGEEVYGKGEEFLRPVHILKKLSKNMCIVIPITSKEKGGNWYYRMDIGNKTVWLMLHQIRFVSANRLVDRSYTIPKSEHKNIKRALGQILELF